MRPHHAMASTGIVLPSETTIDVTQRTLDPARSLQIIGGSSNMWMKAALLGKRLFYHHIRESDFIPLHVEPM